LAETPTTLTLIADAAPEAHSPAAIVHAGVVLVTLVASVGVLSKFVRVPYTVALVIVGLVLALFAPRVMPAHLTEQMVLLLFLPPLLFQGGLNLDLAELRRQWRVVVLLAVPGVFLSTLATAAAIRYLLPGNVPTQQAGWTMALAVGAILAPTDPISVMAVFRALGVPHRLRVMVEGESLFNDGTGAALFTVLKASIVAAAASGSSAEVPGVSSVALEFLRVTGLGALVGVGLGAAAYWLLKRLNDHTLETAITVALAWGAYLAAEHLHGSGVIAVVVAAIVIGSYGKAFAMSKETITTLTGFWDGLDFIVNSFVFLLVGLELAAPDIGGWQNLARTPVLLGAGAAFAALLLSRGVLVAATAMVTRKAWAPGWRRVIWWAGLRGGLSLALVMGLPEGRAREYLLPVVFLTVLATLIVQGTTMQWFIRSDAKSKANEAASAHG
jgi:CPA1 family monovalent cation:H+ antiporter